MGGDHAPASVIRGAALARERHPEVDFLAFGRESEIGPLVDRLSILKQGFEIVHTDEAVRDEDKPSVVLRSGRNSSMRLAIDAVKESASIFKQTWGEQVVANIGIGFVTFLMVMAMCLVAVPLIILTTSINEVLVIPVVLSLVGGFILLPLVTSALKGIYSAAPYRYATTGDPGEHFSQEMMDEAFRPRKRRW